MQAVVVTGPGRTPEVQEFEDPTPADGAELIDVAAAALTTVTRMRAAGTHYSSSGGFPFVPGLDGVGRTADGRRVLFMLPDAPFGSMAERTRVRSVFLAPVPDGLDDLTAAALVNPGMSAFMALRERGALREGETVLVQGATGTTGSLAVQVAKRLGAGRVIAVGRDEAALERVRRLGADVVIALRDGSEALRAALEREAADGHPVDLVVDYLFGRPAEALLETLSAVHRTPGSVRYVITGGAAGPRIDLSSAWLTSAPITVLGNGIGSSPFPVLIRAAGEALALAAGGGIEIDHAALPLADAGAEWDADHGRSRVVFAIHPDA